MGYTPDMDGIKGIKFCDYVEITDVNDDVCIYNIFYADGYGFCLSTDDEPLIKFLHIRNSRVESYYVTGEVRINHKEIKSIKTDDHWMQKKEKGFSIDGTLLLYNDEMGIKYGLNDEEHYNKYPRNYENSVKVKKKIKGE